PRVASVAVREARPDLVEELVDDVLRAQEGEGLTVVVHSASPAERDHLLGDRLDGLRLRLGRLDPAVLDQRAREIRVKRLAVRRVATELLACLMVPQPRRFPRLRPGAARASRAS